jgi:hypothetical protein
MKAAGWTYKASGAGASAGTKDTSGTAANDIWGGASDPTTDSYTNTSTATTGTGTLTGTFSINVSSTSSFSASGYVSILTAANGWQTVNYTGTSGGNQLTGCTGGTGTWVSGTPVAQTTIGATTIGLDTVDAWIVLSGPQTQKIPISAAPTGTPLRGETITQATSSAEGELMGYVWDSVGSSGWMAVLPHTGTFDNTHTITGSTSGATFSPTGTIVTYNREVMFFKDTSQTSGTIYYGCFDASGESTQLFSSLASQTGCTAAVGPGMGGTSNGFPSKGIVIRGTAGSTTTTGFFIYTSGFQTNAQIAATNCTPATGVSADGTFYIVLSNSSVTNVAIGFGLLRLDDTEPGDCDPFVFLVPGNGNSYSSLTNSSTQNSYGSLQYTFAVTNLRNGSYPYFFGNQSRGNGTLDVFNAYTAMPQVDIISNVTYAIGTSNSLGSPMRIINSPATTRPLILEPIAIYTNGLSSVSNSKNQYKGRCRWLFYSSIGNTYDTFESKSLLGVSVAATGYSPCLVIGPYDGSTTPVQ